MKDKIVILNWKAYLGIEESRKLAKKIAVMTIPDGIKMVLAPSDIALYAVKESITDSELLIAAQNLDVEGKGAYTGCTSADQIIEAGCKYVLLGHSEVRRRMEGLAGGNEAVGEKFAIALAKGLVPIVCIGETLEEKDKGLSKNIMEKQLRPIIKHIKDDKSKFYIGYEPVWAISSSKSSTSADANHILEIFAQIKEILGENSENVAMVYGGSINEENIGNYASLPFIDGLLIGKAGTSTDRVKSMLLKLQQIYQ
jgi:triosephosphate isomerase